MWSMIEEPIIEGAGRSATKIIRFFEYPRSIVYDKICFRTDQRRYQYASKEESLKKERTARTFAVIERAQALILDDPGQSFRKLASIVGVSEPTMRVELPRRTFDTNRTH